MIRSLQYGKDAKIVWKMKREDFELTEIEFCLDTQVWDMRIFGGGNRGQREIGSGRATRNRSQKMGWGRAGKSGTETAAESGSRLLIRLKPSRVGTKS